MAWKTVQSEQDVNGATVELRMIESGKGRAKVRAWRIYRNGEYAGYASSETDAVTNFAHAMNGLTRNPETGRYE
jgi:hypothetical protein